jgi:hypothetical protein
MMTLRCGHLTKYKMERQREVPPELKNREWSLGQTVRIGEVDYVVRGVVALPVMADCDAVLCEAGVKVLLTKAVAKTGGRRAKSELEQASGDHSRSHWSSRRSPRGAKQVTADGSPPALFMSENIGQ